MRKPEFQVTATAAVKKPRTRKTKSAPVQVVVKANPDAVKLAHAMAAGRDVRVEVQRDGSLIIRNGSR